MSHRLSTLFSEHIQKDVRPFQIQPSLLSLTLLKIWDNFDSYSVSNIKPNTIILNNTSALPLTQYAESTYPLTFRSDKSAPSVPGLCFFSPPYTLFKGIYHVPSISEHHKDVLFWHLYISQSYTPGMPKYLIILSWTPAPFCPLKSSSAFWRKNGFI